MLAFFIINLVTAIGVIAVQLYICRIRLVRVKLGWILTVLSLLTFGFIAETGLTALSFMISSKTELSMSTYVLDGVLSVVGGAAYSSSFAIFALEYWLASSLVDLAKQGKSKADFNKFHNRVKIVKIVLVSEIFVVWLLLNVFYIQEARTPGKAGFFLSYRYSENVEWRVCKFVISVLEYLLAAFLIMALRKIRKSLKG